MYGSWTEYEDKHSICSWCDTDKQITQGAEALEEVRAFFALANGVKNHFQKVISHGICKVHKHELLTCPVNNPSTTTTSQSVTT